MAAKSDSEIHKQVLQELAWDTRVDETDVGVEVDRSIVTLTGTVDSYVKRWCEAWATPMRLAQLHTPLILDPV